MKKKQWDFVIFIVGILGSLVLGFSVGFAYVEVDDLTTAQRLYIDGIVSGTTFRVEAKNPNPPPLPPSQRCIEMYYPDRPLRLAGCLDAVNDAGWEMPP